VSCVAMIMQGAHLWFLLSVHLSDDGASTKSELVPNRTSIKDIKGRES
jgi:hypothetical protein